MTTIERLWNKAQSDPEHQEIHEALLEEATVICVVCGGESILDRAAGCYNCKDCGDKVCGDS